MESRYTRLRRIIPVGPLNKCSLRVGIVVSAEMKPRETVVLPTLRLHKGLHFAPADRKGLRPGFNWKNPVGQDVEKLGGHPSKEKQRWLTPCVIASRGTSIGVIDFMLGDPE
jgi:hypothetical protein